MLNLLSEEEIKKIEEIEKAMDSDPLEMREKLGITRQQYKKMMREKDKVRKSIEQLTPIQSRAIENIINNQIDTMKNNFEEKLISAYACFNAVLSEGIEGLTQTDLDIYWGKAQELLEDDIKARRELKKIGQGEYIKMEQGVKSLIIKRLKEGYSAAVIKEEVAIKFPKLSKAQVKNAYAESREEWQLMKEDRIEEDKEEKNIKSKKSVKKQEKSGEKQQKRDIIEKEEVKGEGENMNNIVKALDKKLEGLLEEKEIINNKIKEKYDLIEKMQLEIDDLNQENKKVDEKSEKINQSISLLRDID